MAEWVGKPQVILRLGSLDEDPGQRPASHIWTSHEVPWLDHASEIPFFPEAPPAKA